VIGSAGFGNLSQSNLNNLLDYAYQRGIDQIDTAPLYGNSEIMIGNYLNENPNFKISTKVGLPRLTSLNSTDIRKQFQQSLEKMQIQKIHSLFFHSLPISMMTEENIESVKSLKLQGFTNQIGYSGSNKDLEHAVEKFDFDAYMATFNAIDTVDFSSIMKVAHKNIYIKRPLANGIFDISFLGYLKQNLKALLNLENTKNLNSYENRYEIIFGKRKIFNNNFDFFIDFLTYFQPNSKYIFGVTQKKHLKQITDSYLLIKQEIIPEITDHFTRIDKIMRINKWTALE
jgi:hypothetical protein